MQPALGVKNMPRLIGSHPRVATGLVVMLIAALATPALAADKLRVAKSSPESFSFTPLDIGTEAGIFARNGLDLDIVGFSGGAKMHQALAAGTLDIAFGSGPQMALTAKGAPMMAVAMMAGPPINFAVIVPYGSTVKTLDDLKGKRIGVSGNPSLSYYMAAAIALAKNWGPHGIVPVTVGGIQAGVVAALKTGQVDAVTYDTRVGYALEEVRAGRVLATCSDYVPDFITHAIFAHDDLMKNNPDALRRFLKAWFETIAFMKDNKATTVRIAARVDGTTEALISREYDLEMQHLFSTDGRFSAAGLKAIRDSLVPLQMIDEAPDMSKLYTEAFLPKPDLK
jgi:NitT/TauT family transport system substrate-binding protein